MWLRHGRAPTASQGTHLGLFHHESVPKSDQDLHTSQSQGHISVPSRCLWSRAVGSHLRPCLTALAGASLGTLCAGVCSSSLRCQPFMLMLGAKAGHSWQVVLSGLIDHLQPGLDVPGPGAAAGRPGSGKRWSIPAGRRCHQSPQWLPSPPLRPPAPGLSLLPPCCLLCYSRAPEPRHGHRGDCSLLGPKRVAYSTSWAPQPREESL